MKKNEWESYALFLERIKVEGGHLYHTTNVNGNYMCFVPDIDLSRYQSHLRDAYKKGYEDGKSDAKSNRHAEIADIIE